MLSYSPTLLLSYFKNMPQNLYKIISLFLSFCLILEQGVFAQTIGLSHYFTNSGKTILQGDKFRPLHLRYISYDTETNDFQILLDKGDFFNQKTEKTLELEKTSQELMKYFFIGLALPNEKFWVNLRPDSPNNILDPLLEKTDIGRIFLEADLQLKKDTSGMTSPQTKEGKEYWDKLYQKAGELFGTENITIPAITRPWIVPGEIIIGESPEGAYIYKATLKVMLEEDYLNQKTEKPKDQKTEIYSFSDQRLKELNEYSTQLINAAIIPKLTYEVNTSKRYAPLRQVYYSLVLAQWFKQKYSSLVSARAPVNSYIDLIDSGNLANLTSKEPYDKQAYFKQYQKSFKDGEYNLQEPIYTPTSQSIRRYISGGVLVANAAGSTIIYPARAQAIKKEYLVSSAVSSETTEKAKILAENILNRDADKTLFIWKRSIDQKIFKQTIKHINESYNKETAEHLTQELIIRVIIETAGLKDESEMSKSQIKLVGDIMHDALDPSRKEQLEDHIKDFLGRIRIRNSLGQEYYWDDVQKIHNIAETLEKNLMENHNYQLLSPIFSACRKLLGICYYKIVPSVNENADSNNIDDILTTSEDDLKDAMKEYRGSLLKMREDEENELKGWPQDEKGVKTITSWGKRKFNFKISQEIINNFKWVFKGNVLYIRNEENGGKDIWIIFTAKVRGYQNMFSIDWTDEENMFSMSDYEVIRINGKKYLIDRINNYAFSMPDGIIDLRVIGNYNEGVKRLLSSSPAANRDDHRWEPITAERGLQEFSDISPKMAKKLKESLSERVNNVKKTKILVVGAGKGRMPFDLLNKYGMATLDVYSLNLEDKSMLFKPAELKKATGVDEKTAEKYLDHIRTRYISHDLRNGLPDFSVKLDSAKFDLIIIHNHVLRYIPDCLLKVVDPLVQTALAPKGELFAAINNVAVPTATTPSQGIRSILNNLPGWKVSPGYPDILKEPEVKNIRPDFYCLYNHFILYANNDKNPASLGENLSPKNPTNSLLNNENAPIFYLKKDSSHSITESNNDKGGIDFSRSQIISRPIGELQSLAGSPLTVNPDLDFEGEWRGIQMVFNSGIRPSARRLAEFAVSASASPLNSQRLEDLRGLVTDLLRRDEEDEKPAPADPALKELLAIL